MALTLSPRDCAAWLTTSPVYFPTFNRSALRYSGEVKLRIESEFHLRSKFSSGIYSNSQKINEILLHQFKFYSKKFEDTIPKLASRHFMEFVLFEFDQASLIEEKYKHGQLSGEEVGKWTQIGSLFRRSAKYLAERIVLLQPEEAPDTPEESLIEMLDDIWIAAEEMVHLYLLSDQTFMVFPDHTTFEIYPEDGRDFWNLEINRECNIQELVKRDTAHRCSVVGADSTFVMNLNVHKQVIGKPLKETIGASYAEMVNLLAIIIKDSQPAPQSFPTLFLHRSNLIDTLHQHTGLTKKAVEIVLDGFTIKKADMEAEKRELWRPKQEYRTFRRGFFEMTHTTGTHLAFSKRMALESFNQLVEGFVFKQVPPEWTSKAVDVAVSNLSNQAGRWFEGAVEESLRRIGFIGLKSIRKQFGRQPNVIRIPSEVGEIDFLGYSEKEKILLIAECKMVQGGFEGSFFAMT
ncbi:MAG: hypothetical protein H7Z11_17500 [Verrucomicrobia bacterium]|nr:hypothetical protein [Leptolyngbya sp. ES-bin-22]